MNGKMAMNEPSAPPHPPTHGEEELDAAIAYFEANWSGYTETQRRWFIVLIKAATDPFGPPQDGVDAADIEFALRQRADEATRAENEACAKILDERAVNHYEAEIHYHYIIGNILTDLAAVIRARIKPLKERALWAADQQNS